MSDTAPSRRDVLCGVAALAVNAALPGAAGAQPDEPAYPDAAYSRPFEHRQPSFETLTRCHISGDLRARAARYEAVDLRLDSPRRPTGAVWTFTLRTESMAVLELPMMLRHVPEAVSFRAANRSDRPVTVSMQVHESPWIPGRENEAVAWGLGSAPPVAPGQEAELRYAFRSASGPSRPVERGPRAPMGLLVVAVTGLEPGRPYRLHLSGLTLHYAPAAGTEVLRLGVPARAAAGEAVEVSLAVSGGSGPLALELRRDPWVLWRTPLDGDEARAARSARGVTLRRTLPRYLASGAYRLGAAAGRARLRGPEADLDVTGAPRQALPRVEHRLHNGRRSLFVNGTLTPWQGYASYDWQPGSISEFGAHGANVMCVPTCAGQSLYGITRPTWTAPGRWEFGELDEGVAMALQANPEALLFLRISVTMPPFWTQMNQGDLVVADMDPGRATYTERGITPAASMASRRWLRDQEAALRALIRHCKAQPWAPQLAGFWLAGSTTEEWFAWGSNDGIYTDYSAPAQEAFQAWRRSERLPVDDRGVPPAALRRAPGRDLYPGTPDGALAASYAQHQSDLAAATIGRLARAVKRETAGRSLVCTFYGYVLQLAGEPRQSLSGHFALKRLLADPNVDAVGGIPLFEGRDLTNGYSTEMSVIESILDAGKLYCDENDMFSWLHHSLWTTLYDPADPRAGAISMHRRVCAADAVHGAVAQKFSLAATWHHDAALQRDFALQARVNAETLELDRTPSEEIAFLVDDATLAWTPPESTLLSLAHKQLLVRLGRTGAPVGAWLLSDLPRLPRRIRLVVIASGAAARPGDLDALRRALEAGGRTYLVVGPVGLVDAAAGRWRPDSVVQLLGLPIRVEDAAGPGAATVTATGEALGGPAAVRPRATVDEPATMRYADGAGAGAERALPGGGRLIWCGVPPCNSALLRGWAREAGVHLYAPLDWSVHAAKGLVSVTAAGAGSGPVRWPRPVRVTDLFDGTRAEGSSIDLPFAAGQTRLFRVEPI